MRKKFKNKSELGRIKRHYRIRKTASGTKERPRLNVHRSHKNLYVQFIDDISNTTLLSLSTNDKEFKKTCSQGKNIEAAKNFGAGDACIYNGEDPNTDCSLNRSPNPASYGHLNCTDIVGAIVCATSNNCDPLFETNDDIERLRPPLVAGGRGTCERSG